MLNLKGEDPEVISITLARHGNQLMSLRIRDATEEKETDYQGIKCGDGRYSGEERSSMP